MFTSVNLFFLLLVITMGSRAFHIKEKENSIRHQEITACAIIEATATVCNISQNNAQQQDAKSLTKSCLNKSKPFSEHFQKAINIMCRRNVLVDIRHPFSPGHHFDNEEFQKGKDIIIKGIKIIENITDIDYARKRLGKIMHTLQDFYSHSNWVELENTAPCAALIDEKTEFKNIADKTTPTCESCSTKECGAKLLKNVTEKKLLTSGYFGISKPPGKCSHGGRPDFSHSVSKPWDGINKDFARASHGSMHSAASKMAIKATKELLLHIHEKVGKEKFLRLMGFTEEPPKTSFSTFFSSECICRDVISGVSDPEKDESNSLREDLLADDDQ